MAHVGTAERSVPAAEEVRVLALENQQLARHWNEYLEDLLSIGKPPSVRAADTVSMSEFLRRHQELLVTRSVYWHGDIAREEIERVLKHLRFVAETYGLVVPSSATRRAVADLAMLVTLWACAVRGVDSMYGAPGTGPRSSRRRTIKRTVARAARVARVPRAKAPAPKSRKK